MCLKHVEWGIPTPQYPQMNRWVDLMARHGKMPIVTYNLSFFHFLRDQLVMVEDYAYVKTKFHGDIELELPEGSQWGEIGKNIFFIIFYFWYFNYKMFLSFIQD